MSNATVAVVANKYARMRLAPPAEDPLNADRLALATVRIFQFLAMFFRSRIADWLRPVTLRPLVLRRTRYVMLAKVANKDTQTVVSALIKQVKTLPNELYKSLTWDRGKELADHRRFKLATNIDVYFCDPQSPWQRGSNENTNGLLRQYFSKGTDLSVYSQTHLNKVARQLNEWPRKTLEFETPAEKFNACVASTG